jgi:hypothetical protein
MEFLELLKTWQLLKKKEVRGSYSVSDRVKVVSLGN